MRGGPRSFPQGSSCPVVLRILPRCFWFQVRGYHPLWPVFPVPFPCLPQSLVQSLPRGASHPGLGSSAFARRYSQNRCFFPFLRLLRCFSSPGSLPSPLAGRRIHGVSPCGFPHSEIRGSLDICSSPRLFAACHVFLRLPVPGHPPCALFRLTFFFPGCIALQPLPQSFPLQVALRSVCLFLSSYFFPYRLSLLLSLTEQTLPRMSFHCFGSFSIRFSRYVLCNTSIIYK